LYAQRFLFSGLFFAAIALAACGGSGNTNATPPVTTAANATPTPPTTVGSQAISASAGGVTGTFTVTTTMNATVAATAATAAPTAGTVTPLGVRHVATLAHGTSLVYVTLTANATSALTSIAGTFTLAAAPTQPVYLAYWTGTEWDSVSDTPMTVSGTTASFNDAGLNPTIALNPSGYLVLYTAATSAGPLPTTAPSAGPSPTPTSSPSPSPSPSASPSPSPTATVFVDSVCTQPVAATQSGGLANVAPTFFSTIVPNARKICLSAWDLSSNITTALVAAAHNGASVTVITPYSENSSNANDLSQIIAAGGRAKTEYTSTMGTPSSTTAYQQAPMDIHAKMALIDGVAYLDGHNWFSTDVVMQDGQSGDYGAIQSDLVSFPSTAPSNGTFTTDKQVSLKTESTYLQAIVPNLSAANEYDFITESFNPNPSSGNYNDDVYDGMCQIASLPQHVTMHVVVESFSGYSSSAQAALQNLMLLDPNAVVRTNNNGHEKISMVRPTVGSSAPISAWFGSSNATTTDLFDWGMDISDPAVLNALATYFDTVEYANATAIPAAPSGTVATSCGTVHG
jgi:hypothetical protein